MNRLKLSFFLLLLPVFLNAQTAEKIEGLLNTSTVSYEDAAHIVLEAADVVTNSNPAEAFQLAVDRKWLPSGVRGTDNARLDGVCLLMTKAFNFKGGMFYSLFGNSHYAYRELQYNGVIQGRTDPAMDVSGDILFFMMGRILNFVEAGQP